MRLGTFSNDGPSRACAIDGDELVDLTEAAPALPATTAGILALGADGLASVREALGSGAGRRPLAEARLAAPVAPGKYFAIGLNYADHAAEANRELPEHPPVFSKMVSCVNGPFDDIQRPAISEQVDYEAELAIVIGRRCRHVSREDAPGVVGGFTIANDVTVRDWQRRTPQWTLGKSFDTHGPLGPWIVTPDELAVRTGDGAKAPDLELTATVAGADGKVVEVSRGSWSVARYSFGEMLARAAADVHVRPGEILGSGTLGTGCLLEVKDATLGRWLEPGDRVTLAAERFGRLETPIVVRPGR
jgi:2-keto-4-pentenoate hydratase/2-oxohepta-3-ene-1,7-dioic acid hydratase in catechol pathway